MKRFLKPALIWFAVMTLLCGIVYPGVITGIAQAAFPAKANGSVITVTLKNGDVKTYGSELIAQDFTQPRYLIGRPSGTSNLSAVGGDQKALVQQRIDWWHAFDPENTAEIPEDLVTASGSGVDPYISPAAAGYQAARIAKARGMNEDAVRSVISRFTVGRFLGIWGEPGVNVLKVNLALDGLL